MNPEIDKQNKDIQELAVEITKVLLKSVPFWDNGYILGQALERHYVKTMSKLTGKSIEELRLEVHNHLTEVQQEMQDELMSKEVREKIANNDFYKKMLDKK